jgi:hypothetical protein
MYFQLSTKMSDFGDYWSVSSPTAPGGYGIAIFNGVGTDGAWDRFAYPARFSKNSQVQHIVYDHHFSAA